MLPNNWLAENVTITSPNAVYSAVVLFVFESTTALMIAYWPKVCADPCDMVRVAPPLGVIETDAVPPWRIVSQQPGTRVFGKETEIVEEAVKFSPVPQSVATAA